MSYCDVCAGLYAPCASSMKDISSLYYVSTVKNGKTYFIKYFNRVASGFLRAALTFSYSAMSLM